MLHALVSTLVSYYTRSIVAPQWRSRNRIKPRLSTGCECCIIAFSSSPPPGYRLSEWFPLFSNWCTRIVRTVLRVAVPSEETTCWMGLSRKTGSVLQRFQWTEKERKTSTYFVARQKLFADRVVFFSKCGRKYNDNYNNNNKITTTEPLIRCTR